MVVSNIKVVKVFEPYTQKVKKDNTDIVLYPIGIDINGKGYYVKVYSKNPIPSDTEYVNAILTEYKGSYKLSNFAPIIKDAVNIH